MDYEIYEEEIETMDEFMDPKNNDIIYTEDGEELRKLINKRKRENKPISFEEYYKDLTYVYSVLLNSEESAVEYFTKMALSKLFRYIMSEKEFQALHDTFDVLMYAELLEKYLTSDRYLAKANSVIELELGSLTVTNYADKNQKIDQMMHIIRSAKDLNKDHLEKIFAIYAKSPYCIEYYNNKICELLEGDN